MSVELIGREKLAAWLPHAGAMVLLESVQHWDDASIQCRTRTHLDPDNPIRVEQGLSVYAGLEYAAQAMALHGRLRAEPGDGNARQGFIAVASKIVTHVEWLHDVEDDLFLLVDLKDDAGDSSLYEFSIAANANGRILISGCLLGVLAQSP